MADVLDLALVVVHVKDVRSPAYDVSSPREVSPSREVSCAIGRPGGNGETTPSSIASGTLYQHYPARDYWVSHFGYEARPVREASNKYSLAMPRWQNGNAPAC